MKILIVATSSKPPNMQSEIEEGRRPRLDYFELCTRLGASYLDYDPPWMHRHQSTRRLEERFRLDIYWATQIAKLVREQRYDAVLSMSERIGIPLGFLLKREVRHVVILHHPMSPLKLRLMKILRAAHRWDAALALSHAEALALQNTLGLSSDRIRVQHQAIDTRFYRPRPVTRAESGSDFIFSLGVSCRDYPTLIRALRTLPQVNCQISATSAWVSPESGLTEATLPDNVRIRSYNHPNAIAEVFARSRFVVISLAPNLSQWSAGSASVLQPQAMGKPVVATRTPGLVDYVRDGETGILVEAGDPAALAEAIDSLWNNPQQVAAMGRRARKWAEENFSVDKWMDDICHLLAA